MVNWWLEHLDFGVLCLNIFTLIAPECGAQHPVSSILYPRHRPAEKSGRLQPNQHRGSEQSEVLECGGLKAGPSNSELIGGLGAKLNQKIQGWAHDPLVELVLA